MEDVTLTSPTLASIPRPQTDESWSRSNGIDLGERSRPRARVTV
ncbi:hypothetical protein [Streptomyces fagopyri]